MKIITRAVLIFYLLIGISTANITDELLKLSEMYKEGLLSEDEFKKAKSILLEINEITKEETKLSSKPKIKDKKKKKNKITKKDTSTKSKSDIKIERIYTTVGSKFTTKNFEKMKLTFNDFQIYTHRPGAIKVKRISDNKQLVVIGDKLAFKYYNNGQDFLQIDVDKKNKKLELIIDGVKILLWKGQYVQEGMSYFLSNSCFRKKTISLLYQT